jgi:hypothetical protein
VIGLVVRHREVGGATGHGGGAIVVVDVVQIELHRRVGQEVRRHRRHDHVGHHRRQPTRCGSCRGARRARRQLGEELVLEGALGQDEAEQAAAGVGQRELARAAHDQRGGQVLLEAGDPPRQRRLGQVQLARGAVKLPARTTAANAAS